MVDIISNASRNVKKEIEVIGKVVTVLGDYERSGGNVQSVLLYLIKLFQEEVAN